MFCSRARAHVRALMTQESCAVGMRNAKPGNHLNTLLPVTFRALEGHRHGGRKVT